MKHVKDVECNRVGENKSGSLIRSGIKRSPDGYPWTWMHVVLTSSRTVELFIDWQCPGWVPASVIQGITNLLTLLLLILSWRWYLPDKWTTEMIVIITGSVLLQKRPPPIDTFSFTELWLKGPHRSLLMSDRITTRTWRGGLSELNDLVCSSEQEHKYGKKCSLNG